MVETWWKLLKICDPITSVLQNQLIGVSVNSKSKIRFFLIILLSCLHNNKKYLSK